MGTRHVHTSQKGKTMPFLLIAFLLLLLVTIVTTGMWLATRSNRSKNSDHYNNGLVVVGAVPGVAFAIAVVLFLFCILTMVGTRDIGIVTSFGRPVRYLDNGIHTKAPWEKVSSLDGAIQTDNYTGEHCTDIRIGNESTACVDNSVRWRIKPEAGDTLFRDYHTLDHIRDSLVTRELKAALNQALSSYNPLDQIKNNEAGAKPNLNEFSKTVKDELNKQIGDQIDVLSVIIPIIRFDGSTQDKINAYQAEVANTRIAEQREQTANAQATANRNLSKSVSNDPNVLVSKCFDTLDEMVRNKVPVPAGFSCWPGGGSAVVVPSASAK